MITFEQPLNERIRILMRLDFLFAQASHTLNNPSVWDSRATLASIIDIMNIFGRTDLKGEVLKELERLSANLARLEQNPHINRDRLNDILTGLDTQIDAMHGINGQIGHVLRQNEFLTSIRQRISVPGGTCQFDLPGYHYWLTQPLEARNRDLSQWLGSFDVIRSATVLILRLIRESAASTRETAPNGFIQVPLDPSIPYQLLRVTLAEEDGCYPEISGGKHRFSIRFLEPASDDQRPTQTATDIEFELACCAI